MSEDISGSQLLLRLFTMG